MRPNDGPRRGPRRGTRARATLSVCILLVGLFTAMACDAKGEGPDGARRGEGIAVDWMPGCCKEADGLGNNIQHRLGDALEQDDLRDLQRLSTPVPDEGGATRVDGVLPATKKRGAAASVRVWSKGDRVQLVRVDGVADTPEHAVHVAKLARAAQEMEPARYVLADCHFVGSRADEEFRIGQLSKYRYGGELTWIAPDFASENWPVLQWYIDPVEAHYFVSIRQGDHRLLLADEVDGKPAAARSARACMAKLGIR